MEKPGLFREVTPLSDQDCFYIESRYKTNFSYPIHVHPEYELNFIQNAKGAKRVVGKSVEEIDDLELCLIGSNSLEHGWLNNPNYSHDKIHEITIQFHPDILLDSLLCKKQFESLALMFENAKKGIVFSRSAIEKVTPKLTELTSTNSGFAAVLDLIIILYELSNDEHYRTLCVDMKVSLDNQSVENQRIYRVTQYIESKGLKLIQLRDLAEHLEMSEASFSRFIKKRTGKNFVEYLNDIRLDLASRELVNSTKSISEISFECGFNNLSNFNRIFKKRKSITPNEFRKQYAKIKRLI